LSTTQGHSDRNLRIRASGGSAQLDFGRDIGWHERTGPPNPIFDSYESAREIKRQLAAIAKRDRRRRIIDAVRKSPRSTPFAESILRSVERFYASFNGEPDRRQHWSLGADTIEICENVARLAGVGPPSTNPIVVPGTKKPAAAPSVLVVGGTGFIGQQLVRKLLAKGLAVRVLSRSRTAAAIAFAGEAVDIFEGSHGNREVAKAALAGIDTVYHLAKCDGQNWNDYIRGDIEPTRVLAEESLAAGVKRFIYTGTIDSYDSASPRRRITGDTPLDPAISRRNLYARSKARCEELLKAVAREQGLPLIVLRPGIVIGEGAPVTHIGVAQFVSETEVTYWGRGDNKLPLVLVEDVADALAAAADAPGIIGKSFLLTSDPLLSARDYVEEFSAHSGVTPRASNRSAVRYWLADIVKETVKNLIRHPNRRWPSLHDWRCRAHRSVYDSSGTREALGWRPVSDRELMIERGVRAAFDAANRRPSRK
jgi:nucleoside-diphosphate-sugar epimerase